MKDKPPCAYCGKPTPQTWSSVNRALKEGKPIYCDRTCAGMGRRKGKTAEQKKEEKRQYDMQYRATNPTLKGRKAAYYQRTKDPTKEAAKRKARAPLHAEYCRQPEYRKWKRGYDQMHRAKKHYGEFAEAAVALINLENEVAETIEDRSQIYAANGTLNKKQTRRRNYESNTGCTHRN